MHFIVYTVKDVQLRRGKKKKTYPPRYLGFMHATSLKAAKFQQTVFFFFLPPWHILKFCIKLRQGLLQL